MKQTYFDFSHFPDANIGTPSRDLFEKVEANKHYQMRGVFFRTYMSEENIKRFLRDTSPTAWAYILHDKDVKRDGTPDKPHYHVLCKWDSPCFRVGYLARYTDGQQTCVEAPRNYKSCYNYELHDGFPEKYQYPPEALVSFNSSRLTATKQEEKRDKNNEFLADLESGLSTRDLALKYGRDYMLNFKRYETFVQTCKADDLQRELDAIEGEVKDSTAFEISGVDYNAYCLKRNGELLVYLADCLGNCATPCTWDLLRGFLVDFHRNEKANRMSYIRAMLHERGEI